MSIYNDKNNNKKMAVCTVGCICGNMYNWPTCKNANPGGKNGKQSRIARSADFVSERRMDRDVTVTYTLNMIG